MEQPLGVVHSLVYYPVKGCAGTSVTRHRVTATGLVGDRSFMLVDSDGVFLSQRKVAAMATVRPTLADDGGRLTLAAPGTSEFVLEPTTDGPRRAVSVFTWHGVGVDQGDDVAAWASDVLGQPCRLVRVPPEHDRDTSGETPGKTGFADGHALLIASQASLDELNERIVARGAAPVPVNRFRPNVVVAGWTVPRTEDRVREMTVGDVTLGYAKVCIRCAVPTVDQATGRKAGPEPIRTLADYRREPDGGVSFGMKAAVLQPGEIAVGDKIDVHRWAH
ncbi:MOSC domain-containing protein [Goodfellowiella coeruleoviolacea]|nr:MOSC N-terminal beta barrel domain-containing protein [Goodfellowiella coeruleoviolacea]